MLQQAELHDRARNLGAQTKGNALVGLNMDKRAAGLQIAILVSETLRTVRAKLNGDSWLRRGQALSGPQIERHAGPTQCRSAASGDIGSRVLDVEKPGVRGVTQQSLPLRHHGPRTARDCSAGYVLWIGKLERRGGFPLVCRAPPASNEMGGSMAVSDSSLKEVLGNHVAQRAGGLIETGRGRSTPTVSPL